MTRTQRVARATAGRPYSAHRAYPQLVVSRVGIAHHRAITTSSVSDTDPAQAMDRHPIEHSDQTLNTADHRREQHIRMVGDAHPTWLPG